MRIDFLERRAIDGSRILMLVGTLLLALPSTGEGAEEFEVLVLRGSTVARVAGDETGPLSEVTIREDPHPPAPRAPVERASEPEVVIRIERGAIEDDTSRFWPYPLWRGSERREPPRHHLQDWGSRRVRGSLHLGARPPRSVLFGGPKGLRSHRR